MTAHVTMTRSDRHGTRVTIRGVPEYDDSAGPDANPWLPSPPLPWDLSHFANPGGAVGFSTPAPRHSLGWASVSLLLRYGKDGRTDVLRLQIAADFLRDRGWNVLGVGGWCRAALAGEPVG